MKSGRGGKDMILPNNINSNTAHEQLQKLLLQKALHGTTTVGIKTKNFTILAADRRATSGYYIAHKKIRKIVQITDYMAMTTAGLVADAQILAEWLSNHLRYKYYTTKMKPSVRSAAEYLSIILHSARFYPYIVQLLLGGYDTAPRLFNIDWFGSVTEEEYVATGSGSPIAIGVIEDGYRENLTEDEAVELAKRAVYAATKRDSFSGNGIDVVVIGENSIKWYSFDL